MVVIITGICIVNEFEHIFTPYFVLVGGGSGGLTSELKSNLTIVFLWFVISCYASMDIFVCFQYGETEGT